MRKRKDLQSDESGIVAVVVTLFFIIILSLIVLAFSQASRREQRQALDNQLSADAFAAAESGLNKTIAYIKDNFKDIPTEKTSCTVNASDYPSGKPFPDGKVSEDGNIAFSCVLYDKAPKTLQVDKLGTDDGKFVSLDVDSPVKGYIFKWKGSAVTPDSSGCSTKSSVGAFPNETTYRANCNVGMLRVELLRVKPSIIDREELSKNRFTVFFRPTTDATIGESEVIYANREDTLAGAATQGLVVPANCVAGECTASIRTQGAIASSETVYAQLRSVYATNDVTITPDKPGVGGADPRFTKAQIMVDVTGKASDVFRRLQVRVPLYPDYKTPSGFVLDSGSGICKKIQVYPGSSSSSECGGSAYFN